MRRNIKLLTAAMACLISMQLINACSDSIDKESTTQEKSERESNRSVSGKSTEEKVDAFLTDYVSDMKAAIEENDDDKAMEMLKEMKKEYSSRASALKPEVETWEKSLSATDEDALEKRAEQKPYIKDLITIGFTAGSRFNKNPELKKAFQDLSTSVDMGIEDEDEMMEEEIQEESAEAPDNE